MKTESSRYIFLLGVLLLVLVGGAYLFATVYDNSTPTTHQIPDAGASMTQKDPQSFTTFDTGEDVHSLNMKAQKHLTGYGWIDQKNNIVHIPIDRAMDLIVERHTRE